MLILGIETSCDETAVAIVEDGKRILSNVVASQVEIHSRYGGVVPEVASRQHLLQIIPTLEQALLEANATWEKIDAIAVTYGPGLVGALMVGVNMAKAIAFAMEIPLYGINHLEGHIYSAWLDDSDPAQSPGFPLICLIASGGHTDLLLMEDHGSYSLLGMTKDDAAGESFDKAARVLGLGYPGGPAIQKVSELLDKSDFTESLPRAWMRGSFDFSFSGLKTALLNKARDYGVSYDSPENDTPDQEIITQLASAFQESVVDVLTKKSLDALSETHAKGIILGGGVTANARLREQLRESAVGIPLFIPPPRLCVDNGAMIAAAGYFNSLRRPVDALSLDVIPSLRLG